MRSVQTVAVALAMATTLGGSGCASGDSTDSNAAASKATGTQSSAPRESPSVRTIAVRLADGKVEPPPRRVQVPLGSQVRIRITSDKADEVHVHGYDKEVEVKPGEPATVELTADVPGVFEVETHGSGAQLLSLQVS